MAGRRLTLTILLAFGASLFLGKLIFERDPAPSVAVNSARQLTPISVSNPASTVAPPAAPAATPAPAPVNSDESVFPEAAPAPGPLKRDLLAVEGGVEN